MPASFPAFGGDPSPTYVHEPMALRCACPVCAGQAVVVDEPVLALADDGEAFGPQAYLNADQRDGIATNGKPSFTIDEAAYQIVRGDPGWSAALRTPATVSYAFRSTAPSTMPDDAGGFQRFNSAQITQAELALQGWSDVANITFVRVGAGATGEAAYSNSAAILFAN